MVSQFVKKAVLIFIASVLILSVGIYLSLQFSPWPGALVIKYLFETNGAKVTSALEKHVPLGVESLLDEYYDTSSKDAYLDVYFPTALKGTNDVLPTVVWIHGGAWLAGDKSEIAPYLKILSSKGYTVVGVNYTLAPQANHPTQVKQINTALSYLQNNASRLHVNPHHIILAGDSAGANLAAQQALIITNPSYSEQIGIIPSINSSSLQGIILACGPYDIQLANYQGIAGAFLTEVLWSYSGTKSFLTDKNFETVSVLNYLTNNFPTTFITVGNADPLKIHSEKLADKLTLLGVPVDKLFYDSNYPISLGHEYQFNLDSPEGQEALKHIDEFLKTL